MSEIDEYGNRVVYVFDCPRNVRGCTTDNSDGSHTIFINGNLTAHERVKVYQHELKHILRGHFSINTTMDVAESG